MKRYVWLVLVASVLSGCSKKLVFHNIDTKAQLDEMATRTIEHKEKCNCLDTEHYIPKEELSVLQDLKYIYTLFIYMNSTDLSNNWTGEDAIEYAKNLQHYANHKLSINKQMNLPEGNDTPVLPIPWRFVTMADESTTSGLGIYEVIDDDLYYYVSKGKYRNNSNRTVVNKYSRHKEKALNVFVFNHHPDSILLSKNYSNSRMGIALGSSVKIAGVNKTDVKNNWDMSTLYNHEIGHVMGLRHSWYNNDGCDDTPSHPNCFSPKPSGKCKGPVSNNMMDYNRSQLVLTPCQIGIANKYMHKVKSKIRPFIEKDWCDYNSDKSLIITDSLHLDRAVDLKGDIIVREDAYLRISCRVHMPKGSLIIVEPGATLELNGSYIHNDCGEYWGGIKLLSRGKKKAALVKLGKVNILDLREEFKGTEKGSED